MNIFFNWQTTIKLERFFAHGALVLALTILPMVNAFAERGDITWLDWNFSYSTESAGGLALKNIKFKNQMIIGRVSFPVMRVEYDNDVCGPYGDILWKDTFVPIDLPEPYESCNANELCSRTYTQNGNEFLELGINAKIGEYEIYQSYIFSNNGFFDSLIFSRGLQCITDHRHHAQWIFDFDIDGPENDQVFKNTGDLQTSEFNDRTADTNYWTIQDAETGLRVELIPGPDDGFPDEFSQWDVAVRKWYNAETGNWRWGARGEIGDLFNNSESIDREDVVLWYISHLDHAAIEGSLKWHSSGPRVRVINP